MSNRVTLAQLDEMTVTEAASLPIDQIAMLLEEVAGQKLYAKRLDEKMSTILDQRYSDQAKRARAHEGKDTGRVRFTDGDFDVLADLPKAISWNEPGLVEVENSLRAMGEPTHEYVQIKRSVAESAFIKWPSSIKTMFEPHRTLSTGKPSYKLERRA